MVQAIKCPCGKIFAACREPECYESSEWHKDMRNYIKKGCTVGMFEKGTWNFESCTCKNMNPKNAVNENQLDIFK